MMPPATDAVTKDFRATLRRVLSSSFGAGLHVAMTSACNITLWRPHNVARAFFPLDPHRELSDSGIKAEEGRCSLDG
jgi:hypothetical protein